MRRMVQWSIWSPQISVTNINTTNVRRWIVSVWFQGHQRIKQTQLTAYTDRSINWLLSNNRNSRCYSNIWDRISPKYRLWKFRIYILIKLWSSWLYDWLFEAVRTNPGYGKAALIYNNLLNWILGTVILLRSSS